jgi:hypothetical protein
MQLHVKIAVTTKKKKKRNFTAECQWLTPVHTSYSEAEIRRITIQSQPGQIVCETLPQKTPSQKWAGGVAQCVGPEFKPQYRKKKRKREEKIAVSEFQVACQKQTQTQHCVQDLHWPAYLL